MIIIIVIALIIVIGINIIHKPINEEKHEE